MNAETPASLQPVVRADVIASMRRMRSCDVVVVGGGIHGAVFARLAAFNGLKTVLLERNDFASGTSSRSSKMAHGGLRYLEMGDLAQVYQGVRAREDLFESAPHLVHPYPFFIPIRHGERWKKIKLGLGLRFYDLFVKRERRHTWLTAAEFSPEIQALFGDTLEGGYSYFDGVMSDLRLTIENIIAARHEGALCLNYAEVAVVTRAPSGRVGVKWTDKRTGDHHELETGVVVNCAGPWVPWTGRVGPSELRGSIRYSRGSHLLFNRPWTAPALFLPLEEKGRYYFVWPHAAGTLVGTTECPVEEPSLDPLPDRNEIDEMLARLARDLPESGLDRSSLHYCFSGIRTLPLTASSQKKSTARLSRKHRWSYSNGVLSLVGGKFTTAAWTAFEGLRHVLRLAEAKQEPIALKDRKLPGAGLFAESVALFRKDALDAGVPAALTERAIARFGSRVRFLKDIEGGLDVIGGVVLRGEIALVITDEQAESIEDIFRRRLELEAQPGHGLELLAAARPIIAKYRPDIDLPSEEAHYRERIAKITGLLGNGVPSANPRVNTSSR